MKLSEQWLREWVDVPVSSGTLCEQLTAAGLEVEAVAPVAPPLDKVVVAEIVTVEPHPQADRLRLCGVKPGGTADELLQIVCGAPNVYAGMKAPLALAGARLPGGMKIRRSKIRGVESNGMLCSAIEIGLGEDADGIIELPADAPVGAPLSRYLDLDDNCIELGLTPNRGDCLGVMGVARDVAAVNAVPLGGPAIEAVPARSSEQVEIALESPQDCPYFVGRIVRGIDAARPTPVWMRERLRRSGVRSISAVVDVTNYVMLELGQPMHAFDLAKVEGGVRVRRAVDGESLMLLDGTELELDPSLLVIADHAKPMALAGIMGGLETGVTTSTTDVLFECAWFKPSFISAEARRLGLHTDASHRFERAVNCDGQVRAIERATALLLQIAGGEPAQTVQARADDHMPVFPGIDLRASRITRLLGQPVAPAEVSRILDHLGMDVTPGDGVEQDMTWRVRPPAFRQDVTMEADLIEEVLRISGIDGIEAQPPAASLKMRADNEGDLRPRDCESVLIQRGYQEAIAYSFVSTERQAELDPGRTPIELANPISSDLAVMRTSLWPGLVDAMLYNLNRQQTRLRLFEVGLVFRRKGSDAAPDPHAAGGNPLAGIEQPTMVAGLICGSPTPEQWGEPDRQSDFYDLKSDVEALIDAGGCGQDFHFEAASHPALHPGQCAQIRRGDVTVGLMGMLHPRLARRYKLAAPAFAFELELGGLRPGRVPEYRPASRFPAVRRDIAMIVDEQVSAAEIEELVGQAGSDVLKNLELFDVFRGKGIDSGRKSMGLALTFQHPDRTLKDAEVDELVGAVVAALVDAFGGEMRGS